MKKYYVAVLSMLMLPAYAFAQWDFSGSFPDDTTYTSSIHGLAVDGEGKVWVQAWSKDVRIYNADGSEVDFSPLELIPLPDGSVDSVAAIPNIRGLRADHNGDVLMATGSGLIYRLSQVDGTGLGKLALPETGSQSAPGVDAAGNVFTAQVVPGAAPIRIYDAGFNLLDVAVDTSRGFSRSFEVSADGNAIYWAGYSNLAIWKYSRPDEFSPFNAVPDTLFRGMVSEAMARNPATGDVWLSNSKAAGLTPDSSTTFANQLLYWFAVDTATDTIVDSLVADQNQAFADSSYFARAVAFSPDGMTGYIGLWNQDGLAAPGATVQKFTNMGAVANERDEVPDNFALEQNYPNPFNPSTTIQFTLREAGLATLKVYDVMGREIATLREGRMPAGTYSVPFRADELGSGIYVYQLEFEGRRLTGKMTFLK